MFSRIYEIYPYCYRHLKYFHFHCRQHSSGVRKHSERNPSSQPCLLLCSTINGQQRTLHIFPIFLTSSDPALREASWTIFMVPTLSAKPRPYSDSLAFLLTQRQKMSLTYIPLFQPKSCPLSKVPLVVVCLNPGPWHGLTCEWHVTLQGKRIELRILGWGDNPEFSNRTRPHHRVLVRGRLDVREKRRHHIVLKAEEWGHEPGNANTS